jgi:ERCC4-related helicase
MQTLEIKLDIADELIAQVGIDALKKYLNEAAESLKTQLLAEKLRESVGDEKQIDDDFGNAKKQAWDDYKAKYLPQHLKAIVKKRES